MVTEELKKYIRESLAQGKGMEEISKGLSNAGLEGGAIEEALHELGVTKKETGGSEKGNLARVFIYTAFICTTALLGSALFYLWQDRLDLAQTNTQKVRDFYTRMAEAQVSFTDTGNLVFPDEQKFLTQKSEYIQSKTSFIEADLRTMKLVLYENGAPIRSFEILTKGKEGSWWETPTGDYKVLSKSVNAFSSIGKVWMPYSIQFYGNYFIHGWPYYDDGTPVPAGYSGGCIRLSTEDARDVFAFVAQGTPILVLEKNTEHEFGVLVQKATNAVLSPVSAKSFLVTDLSSGKVLLEKKGEEKLPVASITKLMTAVVAHEIIYLGRSIKVTSPMIASVFQPEVGGRYIGLDLLYPLLMQSSNNTANVLAGFVGMDVFVKNMNAKAKSLQMNDTQFADPSGISAGNISTTYDLSKLLQYIYYKREFLFDITRGVTVENVGSIKIGDTVSVSELKNFNEFVGDVQLVGVKNGQTIAARQTMVTVWNIPAPQGNVPVAIIVLGSEDRKKDTEALYKWLKDNFVGV